MGRGAAILNRVHREGLTQIFVFEQTPLWEGETFWGGAWRRLEAEVGPEKWKGVVVEGRSHTAIEKTSVLILNEIAHHWGLPSSRVTGSE